MLTRNLRVLKTEAGFTLVELMVTIALVVVIGLTFFLFFQSNSTNYLSIQKDSTSMTTLSAQATRVANVVRSLTGIVSADNNDLIIYAYFYPSDAYVSKLHYYIAGGQLRADMTLMTANPPTGTPITTSTKTYVIVPSFYQPTGTNLFNYYDSGNVLLTAPVSDTNTIKMIQVNMATNLTGTANQQLNVQISLRNRKTNL